METNPVRIKGNQTLYVPSCLHDTNVALPAVRHGPSSEFELQLLTRCDRCLCGDVPTPIIPVIWVTLDSNSMLIKYNVKVPALTFSPNGEGPIPKMENDNSPSRHKAILKV